MCRYAVMYDDDYIKVSRVSHKFTLECGTKMCMEILVVQNMEFERYVHLDT